MKRFGLIGLMLIILLFAAQAVSAEGPVSLLLGSVYDPIDSGYMAAEPAPPVLLASGLDGSTGSGSAIGPDGALYVTEGAAGRISRVDPQTGDVTTFASGLPQGIPAVGIGGPMDVAFINGTAYALVSVVAADVGGHDTVGIYRVDGPDKFTVVADIGQWAMDNPPPPITEYGVPTGVQYALQPYRGGFLVTDGHHNRVLKVGLDGSITQLIQWGDVVPTGLALRGSTIYVAEAGPIPHLPQDGKIVSFEEKSPTAALVAAGAPLLVDVEFGLGRSLYGLSQGTHTNAGGAGSPADPNTGSLVQVNSDGTFTIITDGLNQPTSLEFIGNTAYVTSLTGEVWEIANVSESPYGAPKPVPVTAVSRQSQMAPVVGMSQTGPGCPWGSPVYDAATQTLASLCSGAQGGVAAKPAGLAKSAPAQGPRVSCGPDVELDPSAHGCHS